MQVMERQPVVVFGPFAIERDCSQATLHGTELPLTFGQRRVLLVLACHRGTIVDRETLYEEAFSRPLSRKSKAIDIHIGRIRRALGSHGPLIVCIERRGYHIDLSKPH